MNNRRQRKVNGGPGGASPSAPVPTQYRQGDVLLQQVAAVPDDATHVPVPTGRAILALGELTGHAHVLTTVEGELEESHTADQRFVTLSAGGVLAHEEHAVISLAAGTYEVVRQREYRPRPQPSSPPRSAWVVE